MCGLNGIVYRDAAPAETESQIRAMNAMLAHRGPDGDGIWRDARAGLGHRRLMIIDLSDRGRQPMLSADGSLALVCNGEIYNYRELRAELARDGYAFQSDTDVEVILPLYERLGERCVERLDGMFAFALWDTRRRRLLLARDRVGEKPLYLSSGPDWLAFSSEAKALLALPFVDRRLNEEAIPLLMVHQSMPAPLTMFRGIEQLPPATYAVWDDGSLRRQRYWRLDYSRRLPLGPREAIEAYAAVLSRSVARMQAASDVPVGVMLSGGVDSSTVAAIAVQRDPTVSSFCVGTQRGGQDDIEMQRADRAASILQTRHHKLYYDELDLTTLPRLIAQYDQPIWSPAILYADPLAERMRQHVKVVLTGNGADEAFGGYAGYARLPWQQAAGLAAHVLPPRVAALTGGRASRVARFLEAARRPPGEWRGAMMTSAALDMMARLCRPEFADRWRGYEAGRFATAAAREANARTLFDSVRCGDLMVCHQHGHCVIPDTAGMAHGLEMRSPFLDREVLELAASLPQRRLLPFPYRARTAKHVTKRHLERTLPHDLIYAKKLGFGYGIPFRDLLTRNASAPARTRLLQGRYLELGIFTRQGAEWAVAHAPAVAFFLLCFSLWADTYLLGESTVELTA